MHHTLKESKRAPARRRYPHTLNEHFHNSLSFFSSLLSTSTATTILSFIQHNSRLPVFQNTHTQHDTSKEKNSIADP